LVSLDRYVVKVFPDDVYYYFDFTLSLNYYIMAFVLVRICPVLLLGEEFALRCVVVDLCSSYMVQKFREIIFNFREGNFSCEISQNFVSQNFVSTLAGTIYLCGIPFFLFFVLKLFVASGVG
jgi:hypothetical protein